VDEYRLSLTEEALMVLFPAVLACLAWRIAVTALNV